MSAAFQIFTLPSQQALDSSARVRAGAKLHFYLTGTSNPADAYADSDLTTPIANPLTADSGGVFAQFFLDPDVTYRIVMKDAAGSVIGGPWDPANEKVLTASSVGALVTSDYIGTTLDSLKRTQAEIDAGVTPVNYAYPPGDVRRYGAVCDGVTDDSVAVQKAFDVGGKVSLPLGLVLKLDSGVTMDAARSSLEGNGGAFKSGLGSPGTVLSVTSSTGSENVARNGIRNLIIYADAVISGVIGINFEYSGAGTAYVAGLSVSHVTVSFMAAAVRIFSNAFCINFTGCMFSQNTIGIYVPNAGDNYGEKITLNHCFLGNNTRCIHTQWVACQIHLVNCSLDYSNEVVRSDDGWVLFDNCYIESNLDTERWFIASGSNARIIYRGGVISIGDKTTYTLAYSTTGAQINFDGVTFFAATNNVGGDFLGSGDAYTFAKNCKITGFSNSVFAWAGGSSLQSMCSNGSFTTNLTGWTTGSNTGGGGGYPTRNATAGSTGGPALEMYVSAAGHDQNIYWEIPAEPGDVIGAAFSLKSGNVNSAVDFTIQCLGNDGTVVGTSDALAGQTYFNSTYPAADTNWHARRVVMPRCPTGTTKARLRFGSDYASGNKAWIENVSMCKY